MRGAAFAIEGNDQGETDGHLSRRHRSWNMSRIRATATQPERSLGVLLRELLDRKSVV